MKVLRYKKVLCDFASESEATNFDVPSVCLCKHLFQKVRSFVWKTLRRKSTFLTLHEIFWTFSKKVRNKCEIKPRKFQVYIKYWKKLITKNSPFVEYRQDITKEKANKKAIKEN